MIVQKTTIPESKSWFQLAWQKINVIKTIYWNNQTHMKANETHKDAAKSYKRLGKVPLKSQTNASSNANLKKCWKIDYASENP